jgi:hypothetical protein
MMKEGKKSFLVLIGIVFILYIVVSPVFSENSTYNKKPFRHLGRACAVIRGETEGAVSSETGFIEPGNYLVRSYRIIQGDMLLAFFNKKKLPVMSMLSGGTYTPPLISYLSEHYGTTHPIFRSHDYSLLHVSVSENFEPADFTDTREILLHLIPSYHDLIITGIVSPYVTIQGILGFLSQP